MALTAIDSRDRTDLRDRTDVKDTSLDHSDVEEQREPSQEPQ